MFGKNNILTVIAKISPIKWTNESIFNIIYGNDNSLVITAVVINLSLAAILMIVPSIFSKKGEV
jgi:ABC-2 type transport system permease protein